ncbi:MAG: methionine--tRNA ligase [Planctomycetota bacterium]|nr:methionine--tRNA ligase [Planctomycetota bacterium]
MTDRRILVTAALPYANGQIHIGHMVEYIQTDIWVRFQKLRGNRTVFVCADDTHGTAIMIRARDEGRTEEEVIAEMAQAHVRDFEAFDIEFDNYGSTNSPENRELCGAIWKSIREASLVIEKDIEQLFDPEAGLFLADRFVRGTCPNPECNAPNQPGDNCSRCGKTYSPAELIDPKSTLSGATPEVRTARHLFIELKQLHSFLDEWSQSGMHLQSEVANNLRGQFLGDPNSAEGAKELRDWDISRPAPYFGFEIPDSPGNYWYVWFDAPIGYMASTKQWCDRTGEKFDDWWKSDNTEIHHFIGKDITYFHTLFWPGMLKTAGFSLPEKVHIHGFLKVDGEKMSKSQGTFVMASTYLKHLEPDCLRYFYASKLGPGLGDIDLNLEEFVNRVNSHLVGNIVNLASRSAKFVSGGTLCEKYPDDGGLFAAAAAKADQIAELYEQCDFSAAMLEVLQLADEANRFINDRAPWTLRKDPEKAEEVRQICSIVLNLFRQLTVFLKPVLPTLAEQSSALLNSPITNWNDVKTPLVGTPVSDFKHMMQRITNEQVEAMIDDSRVDDAAEDDSDDSDSPWKDGPEALAAEPLSEECTIDDFVKVDLRVARVIAAKDVPEANKLLNLTLSLGGGETRNVFAGIKAAYKPEDLLGRLVICVANLKPRQMKFGLSEGMICAAGPGKADVFLLGVDDGAVPGQRIH